MELSADQWFDDIVQRMFALIHHTETNNFDHYRYDRKLETLFYYQQHATYFSLVRHNVDKFFRTRCLLSDEMSQSWFDQLILFRMLGHAHVRLPFNTPENRDFEVRTKQWRTSETSERGVLGPLYIFSVPVDEGVLRFKCWDGNIAAGILWSQYYLYRDGNVVAPNPGDHVIDAGGCFGDTALIFASTVGKTGRVYTFDPLKKHCQIMRDCFSMNPTVAPRIKLFDVGLSDTDSAGTSSHERDEVIDPGARVAADGDLPTRTLDSLVDAGSITRVDFIKMDIEGSELTALKGGVNAIRRWRPAMAISLYHRPEDFFTIPLWLDSLDCGYRFFLDHYSIHHEETVLYATARATPHADDRPQ